MRLIMLNVSGSKWVWQIQEIVFLLIPLPGLLVQTFKKTLTTEEIQDSRPLDLSVSQL